jgi:hypothetical protein
MEKRCAMRNARRWIAPVLFSFLISCPFPGLPHDLTCPPGQFGISDGSHREGNLHFFFLPPLVPLPRFAGTFDDSLQPRVELWEVGQDGTGHLMASPFTMTSGHGSERVRVDPVEELYVVDWHTDRFHLDPSCTYRIRVLVGQTELGYADVDVVARGSELKNVQTGEFIPLLNGKTLPIKFRIERGAQNVVGPLGGVILSPDRLARLEVLSGALSLAVEIGITQADSGPEEPGTAIVGSTVYEFSPPGTRFAIPASLSIRYSEIDVPAGITESTLRLLHLVGDVWEEVLGSSVDTLDNTVSGPVGGFSRYGVGSIANLKGYIRDSAGASVAGALIRLYRETYSVYTVSDKHGFYAFHGVPEGTYFLVVKRDGYTVSTSTVTIQ